MIQPVSLRDLPAARPDRVAGSGLGLAVAEGQGPAHGVPEARPAAPAASQSSHFDRKDIVEIRGNVRPLAADARVESGPVDEEGGGSPEGGTDQGESRPSALQRRAIAAYDPSRASLAAASIPEAPAPGSPRPPTPAPADRKARQLADLFAARQPESALGRILDLAA